MPRPRIGVTMDVGVLDEGRKVWELPTDYARAVTDAGGLPLLLPPTDDADVEAEIYDLGLGHLYRRYSSSGDH